MSTRIRTTIAAAAAALALTGGVATASTSGLNASGLTASDPVTPHDDLVRPQHVSIDGGLSRARAAVMLQRVRELYTFWDTGDVRYLHRADSPRFVDHTLPAGRPQGLPGVEQASRTFRAAVPDLRCTVADVLIAGDRASVRQVYTGHFTGTYDGVRGHGQTVRFDAFDIQQVGARQIVADWHLEDNLTFLQQIGVK